MRGIALSLVTVMGFGIAVAGGGAMAADRAAHGRPVAKPEVPPAASPAGRLWYGGTLAPIIVVASPLERAATRPARSCSSVGG